MKTKLAVTITETEKLFKEHYTLLCLVSFSILKDKDASKDVVHDFFISYLQKKNTITVKVFQAYATRAVKNLSLAAINKMNKNQSLDTIILNQPDNDVQHPMEKPRNYEKLWELLNQLPHSRKEIFISSVIHGQTYAEIAESNGISINTVKTQMKRAYAFLRSKANKNDLVLKV